MPARGKPQPRIELCTKPSESASDVSLHCFAHSCLFPSVRRNICEFGSGLRAALFLLAAHMRPHGDYPAAAAAPGDCAATHVARGSSAHGEPTGRFIACAPPRLRRLAREPAVLDAR
ncbi:hypothetical protein X963_4458 [Burkholderia pseudomallei MSHR7498]|nr:hypothetical protein X963_4458 [Burkholderia pseudomallei MSHR7498]